MKLVMMVVRIKINTEKGAPKSWSKYTTNYNHPRKTVQVEKFALAKVGEFHPCTQVMKLLEQVLL